MRLSFQRRHWVVVGKSEKFREDSSLSKPTRLKWGLSVHDLLTFTFALKHLQKLLYAFVPGLQSLLLGVDASLQFLQKKRFNPCLVFFALYDANKLLIRSRTCSAARDLIKHTSPKECVGWSKPSFLINIFYHRQPLSHYRYRLSLSLSPLLFLRRRGVS